MCRAHMAVVVVFSAVDVPGRCLATALDVTLEAFARAMNAAVVPGEVFVC